MIIILDTELDNCNFVKTILMLLIILYHSMAFWLPGGWFNQSPVDSSDILGFAARWLNSFHIYSFTFVSGYIFFAMKYEKGKYHKYFSFVQNKTRRLLIPYLFTTIIWVMPIHILFYKTNFIDLVHKYFLAESPSQLWFLIMLFDVFIIFWPLSDFLERHELIGTILLSITYGLGLVGAHFMPNIFQMWNALRYLIFFYFGFMIRKHGMKNLKKIPSIVYLITDLIFFGGYIIFSNQSGSLFKILSIGSNFLANMVGAVMAFVILQRLADQVNTKSIILNFGKKHSMTIYLFHQQIIYFVLTQLNGILNPYVLVCMNFLIALIGACLIAVILSMSKYMQFLISGRFE